MGGRVANMLFERWLAAVLAIAEGARMFHVEHDYRALFMTIVRVMSKEGLEK